MQMAVLLMARPLPFRVVIFSTCRATLTNFGGCSIIQAVHSLKQQSFAIAHRLSLESARNWRVSSALVRSDSPPG